jgi:hypothetical protein
MGTTTKSLVLIALAATAAAGMTLPNMASAQDRFDRGNSGAYGQTYGRYETRAGRDYGTSGSYYGQARQAGDYGRGGYGDGYRGERTDHDYGRFGYRQNDWMGERDRDHWDARWSYGHRWHHEWQHYHHDW